MPWRKKWQTFPIFFPEKSQGQRSLVGYSPWDYKELDSSEHMSTSQHTDRQIMINSGYIDMYIYHVCIYVCKIYKL